VIAIRAPRLQRRIGYLSDAVQCVGQMQNVIGACDAIAVSVAGMGYMIRLRRGAVGWLATASSEPTIQRQPDWD